MKDEAWRPDEGPFAFNAKSGATVTGVRFPLVAYNVNLNTSDMKVGEEKFLPVNQGGETSMFEIPVTVFDRKMAVAADTTAMSTPHEIEYTLQFDSASIKAE